MKALKSTAYIFQIGLFILICSWSVKINSQPFLSSGSNDLFSSFLEKEHPKLSRFKDSRYNLAILRAKGFKGISFCIASSKGKNSVVAERIRKLGGSIGYEDNDIDYLRVKVPIDNLNKALSIDEIDAATVVYEDSEHLFVSLNDANNSNQAPIYSSASKDTTKKEWPPLLKLTDYPLRNAHSAWQDIDASKFLSENPTFDGRRVVIL